MADEVAETDVIEILSLLLVLATVCVSLLLEGDSCECDSVRLLFISSVSVVVTDFEAELAICALLFSRLLLELLFDEVLFNESI